MSVSLLTVHVVACCAVLCHAVCCVLFQSYRSHCEEPVSSPLQGLHGTGGRQVRLLLFGTGARNVSMCCETLGFGVCGVCGGGGGCVKLMGS